MRRHHTKIALFWRDLHKHETDHTAESGIGDDDGLLDQGQDGDGLRLKQHWRKQNPPASMAALRTAAATTNFARDLTLLNRRIFTTSLVSSPTFGSNHNITTPSGKLMTAPRIFTRMQFALVHYL
jgi:hypothetical protein